MADDSNPFTEIKKSRRAALRDIGTILGSAAAAGGVLEFLESCSSSTVTSPSPTPTPRATPTNRPAATGTATPDPYHLLQNPHHNRVIPHPDLTVVFLQLKPGDWNRGRLGQVQDIFMEALSLYAECSVYKELQQYGVGQATIHPSVNILLPEAMKKPVEATIYDITEGAYAKAIAQLIQENIDNHVLNPNHQFLFVSPPDIYFLGGHHSNTASAQPGTNRPYGIVYCTSGKVPQTEQDVRDIFYSLDLFNYVTNNGPYPKRLPLAQAGIHEAIEMFTNPETLYSPNDHYHINEGKISWATPAPQFAEVADLANSRTCYIMVQGIPVLVSGAYSNAHGGIYPAMNNADVTPHLANHTQSNNISSTGDILSNLSANSAYTVSAGYQPNSVAVGAQPHSGLHQSYIRSPLSHLHR